MGFWKAFGSFVVVLGGITKTLEVSAEHLPTWLGWLGVAGTWIWGLLSFMAPVPLIIALPIGAVIYKLLSVNMELQKAAEEKDREQHRREAAEREKQVKLSDEELLVLNALIRIEPPVQFEDLGELTSMNSIRVDHALTKLMHRGFVRKDKIGYGHPYHFFLLAPGTAYVVENNLDRQTVSDHAT